MERLQRGQHRARGRDEAGRPAAEEAAEERMRDADAARRLAILRGEPLPLAPAALTTTAGRDDAVTTVRGDGHRRKRKRRWMTTRTSR